MAKKLMRCSETGKLMRDADTGKLMRAVTGIPTVCQWCPDEMPAWLDVTLGNFVTFPDCCGGGIQYSSSFENVERVNDTYRVPHYSGCSYGKEFSGDYGTFIHYSDIECENEDFRATYALIGFTLVLTETGVSILIFLYDDYYGHVPYHELFLGTITYVREDECGDTNEVATNDNIPGCRTAGNNLQPCGDTGIVAIDMP